MRLPTASVPFVLQTIAILSILSSSTLAFAPDRSTTAAAASASRLWSSTVLPDATAASTAEQLTSSRRITIRKTPPPPPSSSSSSFDDTPQSRRVADGSPLSMPFDDLASELGRDGELAAKLVWDCYQIGIDALQLFGGRISLDWHDDYESVLNLLPSNAKLSPGAQARMKQLYRRIGVHENGNNNADTTYESRVASLCRVARSAVDGTTKLVLRLARDGREIETVIDGSTVLVATRAAADDEKAGPGRSLTADEIVAQVVHAQKICRYVEELPSLTGAELLAVEGTTKGDSSADSSIAIAASVLEDKRCFGFDDGRVNVVVVSAEEN